MQAAKQTETGFQIIELLAEYPNTSFPSTGPDDGWIAENSLYRISTNLPYDPDTQHLESADPYLLPSGVVCTVIVIDAPAPIPARTVPATVEAFRAKAVLYQNSQLDAVQALIDDPATDPIIKIAWENNAPFSRTSPAVQGIASIMGWSEQQLDDWFTAAAALQV